MSATRYVVNLPSAMKGLDESVQRLTAKNGQPVEIAFFAQGAVNLLIAIGYAAMSIAYDLRYLADARQAEDKRTGFFGAKGPTDPDPPEGA